MEMQGIGGGGLTARAIGDLHKQAADASLVTTTLNTLNMPQQNTGNADYDFQTSVLMADAVGKGANLNTIV